MSPTTVLRGKASSASSIARKSLLSGGRSLNGFKYGGRTGIVVRRGPGSAVVRSSYRSFATGAEAPAPKRRSFFRRFLTTTVLLTASFYGISTYAALNNDRYHDFFVESVPFGENLVDYFESNDLDLGEYGNRAKNVTNDVVGSVAGSVMRTLGLEDGKGTKEQVKDAAKKVEDKAREGFGQAKEKAEEVSSQASKQVDSAKEKTKDVVDRNTPANAGATLESVKAKASEVASDIGDNVKDLKNKAEDALGLAQAKVDETAADVKSSASSKAGKKGPRDVDASPQSSYKVPKEPYSGPPLPIGFEPPPGYEAPPSSDRRLEPKGSGKAAKKEPVAKPAPPPLPLVAPTVRELSVSEPVLGQLAETIDSLAYFLRGNPDVLEGDKAKGVLSNAQIDLQNLGKRLDTVKEEERVKLEKQLDEQAKEYSEKLRSQERELIDKLDAREEGWKSAFDEERKNLIDAYRAKLQSELETQQEIINQRLKEEVVAQGVEMQRRWLREIKVRVEQERGGRLARLDELEKGLKGLERVTLDNSDYLDENIRVHRVWSALRAVIKGALEGGNGEVKRGFGEELRTLQTLAAKASASSPPSEGEGEGQSESKPATSSPDPISVALHSIPDEVAEEGVESFPVLSTWFTARVLPRIRLAALLPDQGGFLSYLSSAALSSLLFRKNGWTDGQDVMSVLARAEWYLNEKDLEGAARELNQLKGWPKVLARDWLESARKHLEVKQALEVAETEATLSSLLIL